MDKYNAIEILENMYVTKMNFCCCGIPGDTFKFIRDVLLAFEKKKSGLEEEFEKDLAVALGINPDSNKNRNDIENGRYQFILNIFDIAGLVYHGSSIYGASISKYGLEVLEAFKVLDDDDFDMIL